MGDSSGFCRRIVHRERFDAVFRRAEHWEPTWYALEIRNEPDTEEEKIHIEVYDCFFL